MMKYTSLQELLTPEQCREVEKTIKQLDKQGVQLMSSDYSGELKRLLGQWKDQLAEQGIDSNYLAYAIVFQLSQQRA